MIKTINKRVVLAAPLALAKQTNTNDNEIIAAVSEWYRLEKAYSDYPGDPPVEYQYRWVKKLRVSDAIITQIPANTWAGVHSKIAWLRHESNSGINFGSSEMAAVMSSAFDDVKRLTA